MSPSALAAHERREFASELKFLVDPATATRVREWARSHLMADPNAVGPAGDTYHVTSLYFDTADFAIFRRDGWLRYSKFRIRRYGGNTHFLERKLKAAGRVAKHRTAINAGDLAHLDSPTTPEKWGGAWFREKTAVRQLRPVCQIDYLRTARVLATPSGPIRLTLDESIRALPTHSYRFQEPAIQPALTDQVVLELKFRRDFPVLFRELAGLFTLTPHPFSKYRTAVQKLGLAPSAVPSETASPTPLNPLVNGVPCPIS